MKSFFFNCKILHVPTKKGIKYQILFKQELNVANNNDTLGPPSYSVRDVDFE